MKVAQIMLLCLASCHAPAPGVSVSTRVQRADQSITKLIDLAQRERPSAVESLVQIQEALRAAQAAISMGETIGMSDALLLVQAAIVTHPGTDLELGLIALEQLLQQIQ